MLLLINCQTMYAQTCFIVPRHAFLTEFPITISKPWILN